MTSSFRIILTRDGKDASQDDVISVHIEDYDSFRVHYNDRLSQSTAYHYYDWNGLCEYLTSMRHLLAVDADPFDTIQLQVPGFPCISLKPRTFNNDETYETFFGVVESYVNRALEVEVEVN
jgi:hypothetical protein